MWLKSTQNDQVVVLANPKFDKNSSYIQTAKSDLPTEGSGVLRGTEKRDFGGLRFPTLVGTQAESDLLLTKFKRWQWSAKSFTGAEATKQVLLGLHGPYILHLATHGFFDPENSASDADLSRPQSFGIPLGLTKSMFFENPMHRSFLALAGANSTLKA